MVIEMNTDNNPEDPHGFDPEMVQIEQDLLEFLVDGMVNTSGRDEILSRVMVFFFTRKELTQQELQRLTKYSAGTISKIVRQLMEMKIIHKDFIPKTHQHIYKMDELPYGSPAYIMGTGKMMGRMREELQNMQLVLDTHKEEMKDLAGFTKVYSTMDELNRLMTGIPRFMKILETELEEYMKNYIDS